MFTKYINQGITYLSKEQQKDGSFLSLSSSSAENFKNTMKLHPTFPSALILSCLANLKEPPDVQQINQNAASFLLSQKSDYWSFNYWTRESKEATTIPYPDDLDDTFYALAALFQHDPHLLEGKALACIVSILTSLEVQEGGPYRTWMVTEDAPDKWKDVDLAVNSNIAYFLSLLEINIPNMNTFIENAISQNTLFSPYYHTDYPLIYFISRFYKGKHVKKLQNILLERQPNGFGNPLHTALAVSSSLNLGVSPQKLTKEIAYITDGQSQEGSWEAYALYIDPSRDGKKYYAGSKALTTAFCIEALVHYKKLTDKKDEKKKEQKSLLPHDKLHNKITSGVQTLFSDVSEDMGEKADAVLNKILKKDKEKQITLLPYFVKDSLENRGKDIPDTFLQQLGTASLLGWIAYTIYDDFLDEEGDPQILPVATIALRELTSIFKDILPKDTKFETLFHEVMNNLDAANMWEVTNCRIPHTKNAVDLSIILLPNFGNYERLAQRSLGHALAPLALLFFLGYDKNSPEAKNFLAFFTHYIIAKQLLDDAHDFEKDFKKGHITPVVALIIKELQKKHTTISLKNSSTLINEIFWGKVVIEICDDIIYHASLARDAIQKVTLIQDRTLFETIIRTVEASAQMAVTEREKAISFIEAYHTSP